MLENTTKFEPLVSCSSKFYTLGRSDPLWVIM